MERKIILTDEEKKVIEQQLNGEIEEWSATEQQRRVLTKVINDANALMDESEAYEESGDDLIEWYYNKYKEQNITQ